MLALLTFAATEPEPSMWVRALEAVTDSNLLEIVVPIATAVGALASLLASLTGRSQTSLPDHRHRFWRIEPSLGLPNEDVSEWVHATGRVPLVHVHEGSLFSKFVSRLDGLTRRPSSSKPAFVIRRWQEVPAMPVGGLGVRRYGGFRIRVWLHPSEHKKHLLKSMRAPGFRQTRWLAFCGPDQLGEPNVRIRCRAVVTSSRRVRFAAGPDGPYIEMKSADPLLSDFGHRRMFRRDDVPPRAIWMVAVHAAQEVVPEGVPERDPSPPAGNRWWRLLVWPRWFFLPSLVVACYLTLPWLAATISGEEVGQLSSIAAFVWPIMALLAVLILYIDLALGTMHLMAGYIEQRWGPQWTAGTTGCVEDGRNLRNGLPPDE